MTDTDTRELDDVRRSYDALAPHYDELADDPEFDTWISLFAELIGQRPPASRLLDIGCGTGRTSVTFAAMGFDVTAYDLSPRMIEQARTKYGASRVTFLTGDLRDPPRAGRFDVVVCFNEAFTHVDDDAELTQAFRAVHDQLADNGVFVFDLSTITRYRTLLSQPFVVEHPDHLMTIRPDGPPGDVAPDSTVTCLVDWFTRDGDLWRRSSLRHRYRHFSDATTRRALDAAGLTPLRVQGRLGDRLVDDIDENLHRKIHYLAGRAADHGNAGRDERR